MAQKRNHVPKFGNFESDNDVPYTAYFEKARQDKGTGVRMNPNDPEENPEAFMHVKNENRNKNGSRRENHRRTDSRSTSESGSFNSNSSKGNRNRGKHIRKKSMNESEYLVPPSPGPDRHRKLSDVYSDMAMGSVSVPKFGAWDEKDPTSGEGFTVLFNKVKEEKHIAASKFPVVPPQVVTHTKAFKEKKIKSMPKIRVKKWCCLFPREK